MVVGSAPFAGQNGLYSPISPRGKYPLFAGPEPVIGPVNRVAGPKSSDGCFQVAHGPSLPASASFFFSSWHSARPVAPVAQCAQTSLQRAPTECPSGASPTSHI